MRTVKKDNGRGCFCCKLWNCNLMKEACMRENGCQCECPTGRGKVTVEDVEDEYDRTVSVMVEIVGNRGIESAEESEKSGGVIVENHCRESAEESDGSGGVIVGDVESVESAEESDGSGGVIVGDICITEEVDRTKRGMVESRNNKGVTEEHDITVEEGDVIQFKGETDEANILLEFLWMIQKTSQRGEMGLRGQHITTHPATEKIGRTSPSKIQSTSTPAGYRWTNGQPKVQSNREITTAESNVTEVSIGTAREEEEAYGSRIGFPTLRRPVDYHRNLEVLSQTEWKDTYESMIGDFPMTPIQRGFVRQLLYTWRDLFHTDPETMPVTDLVIHTIPTYDHIKPIRSKDRLYSPKEIQWQRENIPRLLKAGVISYCDSPWSAQTKHPVKKDGSLRMVTIFCPINAATIKSNYPMKRVEPIVNLLSQEKYKKGPKFQADATNGYYAIPLWPDHTYKTAFSCNLGQFCYNVMGQGLTGAPHTYTSAKTIFQLTWLIRLIRLISPISLVSPVIQTEGL